jgi:lipoate-protein ligase A
MVLQHGTLPLYGDLNRIIDVLNFSEAERAQQQQLLPERATTLEQVLGRVLSFEAVSEALAQGFAEQLNLTLQGMALTPREQELASQLRAEQYANEAWLKRI